MPLTTKKYHPALFQQCVDLIGDTWNFNELFPELGKDNLINELFVEEATAGADYAELIVDEQDNVQGFLFGILERNPRSGIRRLYRTLRVVVRLLYHYLAGDFGPRGAARRRAAEIVALTSTLDAKRRTGDGYVSLFFVGSSLRGLGWGKRLMEGFERRCRELRLDRIYLWTDKGCNFGFYEHQGFSRISDVSSPLLAGYGSEPNGFVYVKPLAGAADDR